MKFYKLAQHLQQLENVTSRNQITENIASLLKESQPEEIDKIVNLILGQLAPSYKGIVFNIADKMMEESIAEAYGVSRDEVHKMYKEKGDLGLVSYHFNKNEKSNITVVELFETFLEIAKYSGEGSQEKKIQGMASLLKKLDKESSKFATRIPIGKLRLGFSEKTIIDSLSWMERGDKTGKPSLEKALFVLPDIGKLASEVKSSGIEKAVTEIKPVVGIPVQPMLAQRLKSPAEMIKKMGTVGVEPKLDGLRIIIHFNKGKFVKAFTRNMNEVSWMFPEFEHLADQLNAKVAILDVEAIGVDEEHKKLADFQTTMKRRRKHEISDFSSKVPITFYAFDVLLVDEENYMDKKYDERREALQKLVKKGKLVQVVNQTVTDAPEEIARLQKKAVDEGLEGVMVKRLDSEYIPGRTGWRWVKMKEAELATGKLSDTIDAVIMGYTQGKGKRTSFGIGQFLAGVVKGDEILTVTKVGTGLSDEVFKELFSRLKDIQVSEKPSNYQVNKDLEPDFWVSPKIVVELAGDDLTKSPKHTAGYAIRFPRLVKFRDDKSPKQATTVKEVENLYKLQFK